MRREWQLVGAFQAFIASNLKVGFGERVSDAGPW
jgi:hypothetical protein